MRHFGVVITLLAAALLSATCGSDDSGQSVTLCDSPDGSWTNLNSEPVGFRDGSGERIDWTDEIGCAVNLEYVFHRFGDDHCGWQDAEFISIGLPIGSPYTGPNANPPGQDWEPQFFHNTNGAVSSFDPGVVLAELPSDATDTGLRAAGGRELWSSAGEEQLYVQQGDEVKVFAPVADDDVSCA